jgi:hypothetical protein
LCQRNQPPPKPSCIKNPTRLLALTAYSLFTTSQPVSKKLRRGRRGQSYQLLSLEMAAETVENDRSRARTVDNPGSESILRDLSGYFIMLTLESK